MSGDESDHAGAEIQCPTNDRFEWDLQNSTEILANDLTSRLRAGTGLYSPVVCARLSCPNASEPRDDNTMYVNTYVLGVPEEKKDDYLRIATVFAEVAKDFGAVEIFENWELEVPDGAQTDYRKAVKAEAGEKIVLSWVIWPDRETGARAHKGMFEDPRMASVGEMPFDSKRMILGGFEPILSYHRD